MKNVLILLAAVSLVACGNSGGSGSGNGSASAQEDQVKVSPLTADQKARFWKVVTSLYGIDSVAIAINSWNVDNLHHAAPWEWSLYKKYNEKCLRYREPSNTESGHGYLNSIGGDNCPFEFSYRGQSDNMHGTGKGESYERYTSEVSYSLKDESIRPIVDITKADWRLVESRERQCDQEFCENKGVKGTSEMSGTIVSASEGVIKVTGIVKDEGHYLASFIFQFNDMVVVVSSHSKLNGEEMTEAEQRRWLYNWTFLPTLNY